MKAFKVLFNTVALMALTAMSAFAAEGAAVGSHKWVIYLTAGLCISIAAFGTGLAQGRAIASAVEGISRNPSASGKIMTTMIVGLAMIESLAIYALVISLILLFVV